MNSNEVEDCPVQVPTLLSHAVSPWARTKEFVNPAGVDHMRGGGIRSLIDYPFL